MIAISLFLFELFVVSSCAVKGSEDGWINPHSYFFSSNDHGTETQGYDSSLMEGNSKSADVCKGLSLRSDSCNVFLKRFINIILHNTGLKDFYLKDSENHKTLAVEISVTKQTLSTLQRFIAGENVPFKELDECFVTFFENPGPKNLKSSLFYDENVILFLLGLALLIVFRLYIGASKHFNLQGLFLLMFGTFYCLITMHDIYKQYEDIYAKRILALENVDGEMMKPPPQCKTVSIMEFMMYQFTSIENPCDTYLKLKKSIFSEIDILNAFLRPLLGPFMEFLPQFGDSAGKSVSSFSGHFPFPFNFLIPMMVLYLFFNSFLLSLVKNIVRHKFLHHTAYPAVASQPATVINYNTFSAPPVSYPNYQLPSTSSNYFPEASNRTPTFLTLPKPSFSLTASNQENHNRVGIRSRKQVKMLKEKNKLHQLVKELKITKYSTKKTL